MSIEAQARDELAKIINGEISLYERPVFDALAVAIALHAWAKNHGYVKKEELTAAVAAERDACAKLVGNWMTMGEVTGWEGIAELTAAIQQRGEGG